MRVKPSGEIEDVITGLTVPTAVTFGPNGHLYVSNRRSPGRRRPNPEMRDYSGMVRTEAFASRPPADFRPEALPYARTLPLLYVLGTRRQWLTPRIASRILPSSVLITSTAG